MSIDSDQTVAPPLGETPPAAAPPQPRLAARPPEAAISHSVPIRFERLQSVSRRLNDIEIQRLSPSTNVWFEREERTLIVCKAALDHDAALRIRDEAHALSSVRHPNVIRCISLDDSGELPTLRTEFAGRATLATLMPDDVSTVARVCVSLFTTVDELHRSGWTHGKLTADHCIIGPSGAVTLCSFGAATRHSEAASDPAERDERCARDRSSSARIGADLLASLPEPNGRRDRRVRSTLRNLLERYASGDSPERAHAIEQCVAITRRHVGNEATRRSAATRPGVSERRGPREPRPRAPKGPDAVPASPLTRSRALWASAGTTAGSLAAVGLLRWIGGPLRLPLDDASGNPTDTVLNVVIMALRVAGFAAAAYCLMLSVATFAAIATGRVDIAHKVARFATKRVRVALVMSLGVGALASTVSAPSGLGASPTASTGTANAPVALVQPAGASAPGPAPLVDTDVVTPNDSAVTVGGASSQVTASGDTWTVERGDHLWSIAEHVVTTLTGQDPSDAEIAGYWQRLIEANRDNLVDPDNPDLIYVGQTLTLPPL